MTPAASRDDDPAVRSCPSCRAPNAGGRILCGSCGLDLDTVDPSLTARPVSATSRTWPTSGNLEDDPRPAMRWWVPVVALLLVVAGVAAAFVGLGLGPFAAREPLPPVTFLPDDHPEEPVLLELSDVATLTVRASEAARSFTPEHLVDGDLATAWHGEASDLPEGVDEKVDLFLEDPAWVDAVVVDNGDHRDASTYAASARVQHARLVFDGAVHVPVTLLDQGLEPQIVELEEPVLTATVRIEILETVPGADGSHVAISGLQVWGHTAGEEDAEMARRRRELAPAAGTVVLPD